MNINLNDFFKRIVYSTAAVGGLWLVGNSEWFLVLLILLVAVAVTVGKQTNVN